MKKKERKKERKREKEKEKMNKTIPVLTERSSAFHQEQFVEKHGDN
jgi:hypothetical protein